ncbi:MAG: response regulator [Spirochaetaceae bacterium]|nr:MAG: response regulator [Spirochaetaceae bacterium]
MMYRVLIVDDEAWVVESLTRTIPWTDEGFEVVATAESGDAALAAIKRLSPDLALVDIRMPGMSGLDLVRESRTRGHRCEFIMVSGYAEFAYAQRALQYGVTAYCLKPVEADELVTILRRVKRSFRRSAFGAPAVSEVVASTADLEDGSPLLQLFHSQHAEALSNGPLRVLVHDHRREPDRALEKVALISTSIGGAYRATVVTQEGYASYLDESDRQGTDSLPVGVSAPVEDVAALHGAILEAILAAKHAFMGSSDTLVEFERTSDPSALRAALHRIEAAIGSRSPAGLDHGFDELRKVVATNKYDALHAGFIYNSVIYFLEGIDVERHEPLAEYEDLVDLYGDVQRMLTHLHGLCRETVAAEDPDRPAGSERIDEVVRYVEANFADRITLDELTRRFAMSASHLSRSFKRRTGQTITEYLAACRVEYARQLLETTQIAIGQIAEEVGYDSYFYFARVFKRVTGETPSTYRSHNAPAFPPEEADPD